MENDWNSIDNSNWQFLINNLMVQLNCIISTWPKTKFF